MKKHSDALVSDPISRLFNTTFHCLQINNNLWPAAFGRNRALLILR